MNILVIGGAGYVGSHATRFLARTRHVIRVYDNLSRGHRAAVPDELMTEGDVHDVDRLVQVMQQHEIDAVMHFAAFAYVGESVENPAIYYENNVVATYHLLEAMRQAKVDRLVFSSTTATYGVPETIPITEDERQDPINPYGFTKLIVEHMLHDYARAYGLGYAALRYFNAAGASAEGTIGEAHSPETHLIPLILQVALGQRDDITIFGDDYPTADGTCIRDYVHVDDLAEAHLLALEKIVPGQGLKCNLGTGRGHSVQQVVDTCREVTGHPIPTRIGPRRAGDPPELVADASLAKRLLGWRARYDTLRPIIETAWNWHRDHPHGYAKDERGA